jgi:hypothetical protein
MTNSFQPDPGEPRDVQALSLIESLILRGQVALFVGSTLEPRISITTDKHKKNCAIDEPRVREWLAEVFWMEKRAVLREREIERVLLVIKGKAYHESRGDSHDLEIAEILQKEPVLGVIAEFMFARNCPYKKTAEVLHNDLRDFAKKRKLGRRLIEKLPGGSNVLTKVLRFNEHVLTQLGVRFADEGRDRDGRCKVSLTLVAEDPNRQPSVQPSAKSASGDNTLATDDDRSDEEFLARVGRLKSRQTQPSKEGERND